MIRFTLLSCEIAISLEMTKFGACILGGQFPQKFQRINIIDRRFPAVARVWSQKPGGRMGKLWLRTPLPWNLPRKSPPSSLDHGKKTTLTLQDTVDEI
jgi:hypothetical protein